MRVGPVDSIVGQRALLVAASGPGERGWPRAPQTSAWPWAAAQRAASAQASGPSASAHLSSAARAPGRSPSSRRASARWRRRRAVGAPLERGRELGGGRRVVDAMAVYGGEASGEGVEPVGLGQVLPGNVRTRRRGRAPRGAGGQAEPIWRVSSGSWAHLQARAGEAAVLGRVHRLEEDLLRARACDAGTRSTPTERRLRSSQRRGTGAPSPRRAESTITSSSVRTATRSASPGRAAAGSSGAIAGARPSSTKCFDSETLAAARVAQHDADRVAPVGEALRAPGSGPPRGSTAAGARAGGAGRTGRAPPPRSCRDRTRRAARDRRAGCGAVGAASAARPGTRCTG